METKKQRALRVIRWRRALADGRVVEIIDEAGNRTLTGYPSPEQAEAIAEAVNGGEVVARVYRVSLEEQAEKLGLPSVPPEWVSS